MAVDLEAIARRGRCDVSSLKLALPLLEQGYQAPFLARYRRDELGGLDESTLWSLKTAVDAEQSLKDFREKLHEAWAASPLADPAIGDAIRKSGSNRTLQRLGKRLRQETSSGIDTESNRLAVRMLNPQKGDPADAAGVAERMESVTEKQAAVDGLAKAIPSRLAGDPRVISAAVRWLSRNAKIHISNVHDPHIAAAEAEANAKAEAEQQDRQDAPAESSPAEPSSAESSSDGQQQASQSTAGDGQAGDPAAGDASLQPAAVQPAAVQPESASASEAAPEQTPTEQAQTEQTAAEQASAHDQPSETPAAETAAAATDSDAKQAVAESGESSEAQPETSASGPNASEATGDDSAQPAAEASDSEASPAAAASGPEALPGFAEDPSEQKSKGESKKQKSAPPKKQKKISPRQRRRRWLVSVLKPLEGKRLPAAKLSAFQVVMLGRALRSQVAVCSFEYDAAKLVGEIKRTVVGLNKGIEAYLGDVVMQHEADIREAAEAAWWDELHERASARLVTVVADHLRKHVNRGPIEAKVVMSIDAVGPKTAATAIVSADGRVLHGEDLPCQLSGNVRGQTVAKMGELIHQYNVDLVVVSNGPARRACLIALGDLIGQSPENSIRWTVADRSGADSYSSSDVANSEMRSTPRRFRAAAWVAFSVLHPAQAYAKVDPLKLRLSSFQSELSDEALEVALGHIMASGASRGGVDANAAPLGWLRQLPGMSDKVAESLVARREDKLLGSRQELLALDGWETANETRQALPFLRVFQSEETLDGTLIHPDDYALAKKLAKSLEIELPPDAPPGYQAPSYEVAAPAEPKLVDATAPAQPAPVEDFDRAGEKASEFDIGDSEASESGVTESGATEGESADAAAESQSDAAGDEAAGANENALAQEQATAEEASVAEDAAGAEPSSEAADADGSEPASEASDGDSAEADQTASDASETEAASSEAGEATAGHQDQAIPDPIRHPRPEQSKVDKCIKEWQIGRHRANQLVGWLCDPFGETAISDAPPGVLSTMPTLKTLTPGDQVIGVVVGVMSFGVFVELAPDCSGLIHVSRLSDGYVEDLNEAIQVGDVITAWVTGIDEKRRRVGLSALSPEQEKALEQDRQDRRGGQGGRGGYRRDSQSAGGRGRQGQQGGGQAGGGQRRGGKPQGAGQGRGGQGEGGRGQGTQGGRGQGSRDQGGRGQGGRGQGGRGQGGRGQGGRGQGGRGQGRGGQGGRGRKPRQPESYRVVAKPEAKPITDAMQKGDEPLRSFGDLMQFYSKQEPEPKQEQVKPQEAQSAEANQPQEAKPEKSPQQTDERADVQEAAKPAPEASAESAETPKPAVATETPAADKTSGDGAGSNAGSDAASDNPTGAAE